MAPSSSPDRTPAAVEPPRCRMSADDRREAILAAGRRLFAERGYQGTATSRLAAAAGCSEAILYRHFPSKQALFAAVLARAAADLRAPFADALATDDPFGTVLRVAASLDRDVFGEVVRLRSLAVTLVHEPEIRAVLEELGAAWREMVAAAAAASQEAGHMRTDVPPEHVGTLFSGLSFLAAFWYAIGGDAEFERLLPVLPTLGRLVRPHQDPQEAAA